MRKLPSGNMMPIALNGEHGYLTVAEYLLERGAIKADRTGTGTYSRFGVVNVEYDLLADDGCATVMLPSTKNVFWDKAVVELVWMLSGSNRLKFLIDNKVNFWNNWVKPGTEVFGRMLEQGERFRMLKGSQWDEMQAASEGHNDDAVRLEAQEALFKKFGIPQHKILDGDLGPVYGVQWRHWEDLRLIDPSVMYNGNAAWEQYGKRGFVHMGTADDGRLMIRREIDQIARLEKAIKERDDSAARRNVLSAWNVAYLEDMALPPCHTLAQWGIERDATGELVLHCKLYQRSGDWFLGVPYNVAFYSIFTHMLCAIYGLKAGKLFHTVGDAHVYSNHVDQVREQLATPINEASQPRVIIERRSYSSILDFKVEDITIDGYVPGKVINAPVAV